jgi:hypothetical protein
MARVALWHLATIILEPKRLSGLEGSLPRSTELSWPHKYLRLGNIWAFSEGLAFTRSSASFWAGGSALPL